MAQYAKTYVTDEEGNQIDEIKKSVRSKKNRLWTRGRFVTNEKKNKTKQYVHKKKVYSNLALCNIKLERYEKALDNIELALKIKNDDPKLLVRKGQILAQLKSFESARKCLFEVCF